VGAPKARRGGRPKGGGKRATEALSLVRAQPGITIPELAAKMGIKQNYLYRVLPGLEKEGKLEKKGRGWYPKGA
jgi:DNA-binding IclR family transcriptional regulator